MSYLETLLNGVAVAWRPLGEIAVIYGGLTGKSKSDFEEGNAKYVSYKNIFANIEVDFESLEAVKVSDSENQHAVEYGDVLFTGSSETADEVGMSSSVTDRIDRRIYLNSFSFGVRFHKHVPISPEFSKHLFRSDFMRSEISRTASGVTRFNISKERFRKIEVPIPCCESPKKSLEIQAEIVRILDTFTELTAALTAELTARKKQYNYYRDQLLNFEDVQVTWKTLGVATAIKTGQAVNKQMISANPGEYAVINSGREPLGYINEWNTDNDPIGITSRGAGVGSITWKDGRYFRGNLNYSVTIKDKRNISTRYLYHLLLKMQPEMQALCTYDGIPALNAGNLKELGIPIPPLVEQERIAAILDKFDTLTNSITEGLPREIELRQKQYEHYRNVLLSFPKPKAVTA